MAPSRLVHDTFFMEFKAAESCVKIKQTRVTLNGKKSSGSGWRKASKRCCRRARRIADLRCAALERRENAGHFLVVQRIGGVARLRRGNHQIGHDLAVEVGAQADRDQLVPDGTFVRWFLTLDWIIAGRDAQQSLCARWQRTVAPSLRQEYLLFRGNLRGGHTRQ